MDQVTSILLRKDLPDILSSADLSILFTRSSHGRYSLVKRLLQQGKLLHLRKGLYMKGFSFQNTKPNLFYIANRIYPFSYISLDSALSFYQIIPETVNVITSVGHRRRRSFSTFLGEFEYKTSPVESLFDGVIQIKNDAHTFLIATIERAFLDFIFDKNLVWKYDSWELLTKGYRFDEDILTEKINLEELIRLAALFKNKSVLTFAHEFKKEVHHL